MEKMDLTTKLLVFNASLQIFISTLLGFIMLIPLQPWGSSLGITFPSMHAMLAVHLDWYMLAFLQFACGFLFYTIPNLSSPLISKLLMFGGWINPIAYLLRDYGINAFVLGGSWIQIISASISGISAISILFGWGLLLFRFYHHLTMKTHNK